MTRQFWWIATYGDMGIELSFLYSEIEYLTLLETVTAAYEEGDYDSYTCGEETAP